MKRAPAFAVGRASEVYVAQGLLGGAPRPGAALVWLLLWPVRRMHDARDRHATASSVLRPSSAAVWLAGAS